jgi:hypothetical protein
MYHIQMKKILVIAFALVLIPQIAAAAWWNPFSWFKKKAPISVTEVVSDVAPVSNESIVPEPVVVETPKKYVPVKPKPVVITKPSPVVIQESTGASVEVEQTSPTPEEILQAEKEARIKAIKQSIADLKYQNAAEVAVIKQQIIKVKADYAAQVTLWETMLATPYDVKFNEIKKLETALVAKLKELEAIITQKNSALEVNVLKLEAKLVEVS